VLSVALVPDLVHELDEQAGRRYDALVPTDSALVDRFIAMRAAQSVRFHRTVAQSLGATRCHVAAEILGEDPDRAPWN